MAWIGPGLLLFDTTYRCPKPRTARIVHSTCLCQPTVDSALHLLDGPQRARTLQGLRAPGTADSAASTCCCSCLLPLPQPLPLPALPAKYDCSIAALSGRWSESILPFLPHPDPFTASHPLTAFRRPLPIPFSVTRPPQLIVHTLTLALRTAHDIWHRRSLRRPLHRLFFPRGFCPCSLGQRYLRQLGCLSSFRPALLYTALAVSRHHLISCVSLPIIHPATPFRN